MHLDLNCNNIKKGVPSLSSSLSKLYNLKNVHLELKKNSIGSQGVNSLSSGLNNLKNLLSLKMILEDCAIGDQGCLILSGVILSL